MNYEAAWKKIDSLVNKKGLTQSALTEVNKIYTEAKKSNNQAQLIKALLYRINLAETKEENSDVNNIQLLEKEIAGTPEPAKAILQSITAQNYWNYFQNNRWKFYNRSETVNFKKEDIATWSITDLHKKISEYYLASLKNEKQLQQTKLEPYDVIITKGNVRYLRPTLFDLLAHRALEYFKNDEREINRAANSFEINDNAVFADAKTFATHHFTTSDSLSLHYKALQLYQRLIQFHLTDTKPDALLDADIARLSFAYDKSVSEQKDALYQKALVQITDKYSNLPAAAQAWYLQAEIYAQQARKYEPLKGDSNRYAYLQAKAICEKVAAQPDSSEGKTNCLNLLRDINSKTLAVQMERVNIPGQPSRALISFRNFTQVYFRIVAMDRNIRENLGTNQWEDEYWQKLLKVPVLSSFAQALPDTKDYQAHNTEIKVNALPAGAYALIASVNKDFSINNNPLAVQYFYVSNISFVNKGNEYLVLHRETGQPQVRANVQVWYRYYEASSRKYLQRKGENIATDKNGAFTIYPSRTNNRQNELQLEITTQGDHLFMDDYIYNYSRPENPDKSKNIRASFLFTDRSIYRPSQTIYFKGILTNRNNAEQNTTILPNEKVTIVLFDVNNQRVDSLKLTTSEFGSYSGKFTLPSNVLTGEFRIEETGSNSRIYFSVEEYKRPKFFTEISKPAGTYRINDSIQVTGTAKAYAGNNIDGAQVKYRVVRRTRILYPFFGKTIWPPAYGTSTEITNGTTTTDATGAFHITFKALPDNSIDKGTQPLFYYEVSADVTDINGETRSSSTSVAVAYQALQMEFSLPDRLPVDSLHSVPVSTKNLNDIFEKTTATVSIYPLKTPLRTFRQRYWTQPDQFVMTQQEYYQAFPYDVYSNEDEVAQWPRQPKAMDITDTTTAAPLSTRQVPFSIKTPLSPGWYVIEAIAKDKYGEEVKAVKYIQLYDKQTNTNPLAFGNIDVDDKALNPGEKASYTLSTNLDSVYMIHDIVRQNNKTERNVTVLDKNSRSFDLPVTESDRGGAGVQFVFVKHNRAYLGQQDINIPYTNKQLTIDYKTYRDKTLPGSEEKWAVNIKGTKGDKVAAEMLTAMYDASLDQFKPHSWNTPGIWPVFYAGSVWSGNYCFRTQQSATRNQGDGDFYSFEKEYDVLLGSATSYVSYFNAAPGMMRSAALAGRAADNDDMAPYRGNYYKKSNVQAAAPLAYEAIKADTVQQGEMYVQGEPVKGATQSTSPQLRKNFNETAFFFPDLKTDAEGNISFSFTMPESLTTWKWMTLAHTKELAFGYNTREIITQKELMVQANAPRFMREGDRMDFSGKIVNMTNKEITGQVELQLIDPTTNQSVDGWFRNMFPNQFFTVAAGQSTPVAFTIEIPYQYNKPVTYRLIASTKSATDSSSLSDGEEALLPVISNRMLVTESLPLPMNGTSSKKFTFTKLLQSGNSETLNQHALTVEFTTNPAWYAVQSLPYLTDYPYECAEQTFNRYYANALASSIANSSPRIKEMVTRWQAENTRGNASDALLSNLQKNEELKSVLLQETPWVLAANNEAQQKKNIALLFDMVRMNQGLTASLAKLKEAQLSNGGFTWFKGGNDDRFVTQYIATGFGHLQQLKALPNNEGIQSVISKAVSYLDARIKEDYDNLVKNKAKLTDNHLGSLQIQYLYMRSFFPKYAIPATTSTAYNFYKKQAQQYWLTQSRFMQGMIALALNRTGETTTAKSIVASLKQNALTSEEMGMYWKELNTPGYFWYQAPVETQSLLIEVFTEVTNDTRSVEAMKTWLLKQKQTQNWRTTKATADACYALLLQGNNWLVNTPAVTIQLGDYTISSKDQQQEDGTGYFKKVIDSKTIKPAMGNIQVTVQQTGTPMPSWGAVYWQYFDNLENITASGDTKTTPLQIIKKIFVEKNTDRGPVLQPVNAGDALKVGDKVKVRIELRADRAMEYVHMKDMRAACMEPVNVLSQYKWQGGLGYYEATKDASTNFFFNWLPKGTYVFEYSLFVTHTGTFSNGVTSIQCMYAPEFTSHSEGIKVNVE
ncbi:MAG: alpha-2-macroglobulin family protein [Chitinophagaceae bacterium]